MKTERIEELMTGMKAFGKENYHKSELLGEMFALQQEIVELAFNGEHASTADLKIWDVERHLEQLNEVCGHAADEEFQKFQEGSRAFCNLIKAEISGNRGEYKAFKALEYIRSQNRVFKNVELRDGEVCTELDAVVVTPKCLTIVEVKNTSKNIFIDEGGNYYRTGEFLKWDCNIAEKMSVKENLLRKALKVAGFGHLQIRSIVVFTNNRIEVHNKYCQIRTCFLGQLAYIIDGYRLEDIISTEEMDQIQNAVKAAECKETYPMDFDVQQYKADFANLIVTLEMAMSKSNEIDVEVVEEKAQNIQERIKVTFVSVLKSVFSLRQLRNAGSTAAAVAIAVASGVITANSISKAGF